MISIIDNSEESRYELRIDEELAGLLRYRSKPKTIALMHTETGEQHRGKGLAERLVRAALEDARRRGLAVLPFCPYVKAYLERHPDDLDLVPAGERSRFGL
jgi:uncharacterized protein